MQNKLIQPTEIFRGAQEDFYKTAHFLQIDERNKIQINYTEFYQNSLFNPKTDDINIIEQWKKETTVKFQNNSIPTYVGKFGIPLQYQIIKLENYSILILLGAEEIQPFIYRLCIEEIWEF